MGSREGQEAEERLVPFWIAPLLEIIQELIRVVVSGVKATGVFLFVGLTAKKSVSVYEDSRNAMAVVLDVNLHINLDALLSVDRTSANRKPLLHGFPTVVITAAWKHGECLLKATIPRPLRSSHAKVPLGTGR